MAKIFHCDLKIFSKYFSYKIFSPRSTAGSPFLPRRSSVSPGLGLNRRASFVPSVVVEPPADLMVEHVSQLRQHSGHRPDCPSYRLVHSHWSRYCALIGWIMMLLSYAIKTQWNWGALGALSCVFMVQENNIMIQPIRAQYLDQWEWTSL